ncbi:MAG: hypothetical protein R8G66_17985 [Cytophagales bacterium]|nr:hypothetical protein [Cytophagales bacterium]
MYFRHLLVSIIVLLMIQLGYSQPKTLSLKKGQALDLLLLTTNPDAKEKRNEYFAAAVSVAQQYGYTPQYSSGIKEPPTQGNYWPEVLILATWKVHEDRVKFVKDIEAKYPPFHEMRREIWPTFHLTYWNVEQDQEVTFDPEKFYVATAHWEKESKPFKFFAQAWAKEVSNHQGAVVLEMKSGISPFGYHYNPDLFTITEWESREAFEQFHAKNVAMDHKGVLHVNQFVLQ